MTRAEQFKICLRSTILANDERVAQWGRWKALVARHPGQFEIYRAKNGPGFRLESVCLYEKDAKGRLSGLPIEFLSHIRTSYP